ncbi:MAG: PBP1A family penicillin-binding protein [Oscillospiraceae bacterium]|nr:PBP1A family penicillin-binding protein [Oscillospiraceae bacterium]
MSHKKKKAFVPIPRERALVVREASLPVAPPKVEEVAPPAKKTKKKKGFIRRHWRWIAAAVFTVGALVMTFGVFEVQHWQPLDTIKLTKLAQTSRLYDREGALVATLRGKENRTTVPLERVPLEVQNAFIAAEDLRFQNHNGFDLVRIFGSIYADLRSGSYAQGASTITQQLVKLTHLSNVKSLARKAEEIYLAIQVEARYTKDEILEMYLNTIYFGEGAYGIQTAAEVFFDKDVSELTAAEGAALAATIKAPSAYGPIASPETNQTRRNYILRTMAENGLLDPAAAEVAQAETLTIAERKPVERAHGWYVDAALEEAEKLLGVTADELLNGGYFIETAMDTDLQIVAEDLFANASNFPSNAADGVKVQGALSATDTKTGGIAALIGGREYTVQRGFNRATHMRRQPGSAIKPLAVYAPAIELGYTTASILLDEREDFGGGYNPRNSGNHYYGNVTLRRALALSLNTATVRLMRDIGVSTSMNFLKEAGIPLTDTDANLSLALGAMTTGVTPAELSASYAMFGNGGVYNPPYIVEKIFAPDGALVYQHEAAPRTVLSPQNNYLMTSLLQSVTGWGTGSRLSATGLAVAGKTGTNSLVGRSGNRDIWMAAYTSDYAVACWMGYDNTDATHYLPSRVSGGDATASLAAGFLRGAYQGKDKPSFKSPGGLVWLTIDVAASAASGYPLLASASTPADQQSSEVFLESNRPWTVSTLWQTPRACSYFYIDFESGMPKLMFGASDSANYRIERVQNGQSKVITELYGASGQSLSYIDWTASAGEWYTYRVTPVHSGMLDSGVLLEGPASSQSVQARAANGFLDTVKDWLVGTP